MAKLKLLEADKILREYVEPNSMIDNGNLFFAATEYKEAYTRVRTMADEFLKKCERHDPGYTEKIHSKIDHAESLN